MSYDEFAQMYRAIMAFVALSPQNQDLILLLMDGFKYRELQKA